MKTLVLCHIPKDSRFHTEVFLANLRRYPPASETVLFGPEQAIAVKDPPPAPDSRWFYQNLMFFTAARIANGQKADWMLYLECDCRLGQAGWDTAIMREAFDGYPAMSNMAVAGSMVVCNPCCGGPVAYRRWTAVVAENAGKRFPIPAYGNRSIDDARGVCVMVNGALGLYSVPMLVSLFPEIEKGGTMQLSKEETAWDKAIGNRLWDRFGAGSYDRVRHLQSIFSCFGDVLTTESERLNLLRDKIVVGVHAVKSRATV